jgi:hypothetical protein
MLSSKASFITTTTNEDGSVDLTVTLRDDADKEPVIGYFPLPIVVLAEATSQPYAQANITVPYAFEMLVKFGENHYHLSAANLEEVGMALFVDPTDWPGHQPFQLFDAIYNPGAFGEDDFHARIGFVCPDGVLVTETLDMEVTA